MIDLPVENGGAFPFDSRETVAFLVSFCQTEKFAAELDSAMLPSQMELSRPMSQAAHRKKVRKRIGELIDHHALESRILPV